MEGMTKGVLLGAGIAAAGGVTAVAITRISSHYLVRMAMDRDGAAAIEKKMDHLAGTPLTVTMKERLKHEGRKLEKVCEDVKMQTLDGLTLAGHWRDCDFPKRVIIAMHGWRSSWCRDFGLISDFWHENGCAVLYPEQRGQGNSQGEYLGFGLLERHDCREWIDWVNRKTEGKLPIYLAGISMGATTVLMTAGMELPENVRGIIADCGFTSADDIWRHVAKHNLHLNYGIYAGTANALCKKRLSLDAKEYSTLDAMAECDVPVLFIHGTEDAFVPVEMTYENYKACAAPKHLLVVPGANHGMSYWMNTQGYQEAVQDFFRRYDTENHPE